MHERLKCCHNAHTWDAESQAALFHVFSMKCVVCKMFAVGYAHCSKLSKNAGLVDRGLNEKNPYTEKVARSGARRLAHHDKPVFEKNLTPKTHHWQVEVEQGLYRELVDQNAVFEDSGATCCLLPTAYHLLLTTYYLLLTTYYLLLATCYLLLTTCDLLLTTYCLLLATCYLLLSFHYSIRLLLATHCLGLATCGLLLTAISASSRHSHTEVSIWTSFFLRSPAKLRRRRVQRKHVLNSDWEADGLSRAGMGWDRIG